jgi:hypothetical protein
VNRVNDGVRWCTSSEELCVDVLVSCDVLLLMCVVSIHYKG